jgi:hypothetical protein
MRRSPILRLWRHVLLLIVLIASVIILLLSGPKSEAAEKLVVVLATVLIVHLVDRLVIIDEVMRAVRDAIDAAANQSNKLIGSVCSIEPSHGRRAVISKSEKNTSERRDGTCHRLGGRSPMAVSM